MKKANELLDKYSSGMANSEERAIVENWYANYSPNDLNVNSDELLTDFKNGRNSIREVIGYKEAKIIKIWPKVVAAAVLLIFFAIGFYFYQHEMLFNKSNELLGNESLANNTPFLTLSDGRKVSLNDPEINEILKEDGVVIDQNNDGLLKYSVVGKNSVDSEKTHYHTIETPVGVEYTLVLPDNSKVFLSSGSKLRYPTYFAEDERKVELEGQAFFEISSIYKKTKSSETVKKIPFIVLAGLQKIEVLGTQFNVTAYNDDEVVKTALLEGSVRVSQKGVSEILKPGQMALSRIGGSEIDVQNVDIEDIKAWKEGYFIFNNEDIKSIMNRLSKWYGFETEFIGDMTGVEFHGNYLRSKDINILLETLEMTNKVNFKIEKNNKGRTIYVTRITK